MKKWKKMNGTLSRLVKITRDHIKNNTDVKETLSVEVILNHLAPFSILFFRLMNIDICKYQEWKKI